MAHLHHDLCSILVPITSLVHSAKALAAAVLWVVKQIIVVTRKTSAVIQWMSTIDWFSEVLMKYKRGAMCTSATSTVNCTRKFCICDKISADYQRLMFIGCLSTLDGCKNSVICNVVDDQRSSGNDVLGSRIRTTTATVSPSRDSELKQKRLMSVVYGSTGRIGYS